MKEITPWTTEEDKILREHFENGAQEEIEKLLPYRAWRSIKWRGNKIGLKRDPQSPSRQNPWSEAEDTIIRSHYTSEPQGRLLQLLPSRTWRGIRCRGNALGLKREKNCFMSETREKIKKTLKERYGVDSTFELQSVKNKIKETNIRRRRVAYPTQSVEIRAKVKKTVQERYGVSNVFQDETIKEKIADSNIKRFGVTNPNQSSEIREKTKQTNLVRYGVENPFQLVDHVREGMLKKYGVTSPLKSPEIKAKVQKTNIERYGAPSPAQNSEVARKLSIVHQSPEIRAKKIKRGLNTSKEEDSFYRYLLLIDEKAKRHRIHPSFKFEMDYYLPLFDMWVQYDGVYWHGKEGTKGTGPRAESIQRIIELDKIQNENIPNLIRFWSDEVPPSLDENTIVNLILNKIEEKRKELMLNPRSEICHQYRIKQRHLPEDLETLPFNPEHIKARDLILSNEPLSDEVVQFIIKYEWLGTIGVSPKWCFTARYKSKLAGVVLINEPVAYSHILGENTPKLESLIQRGASASWAPKNTSSRLVRFSCKWMVENTSKRVFVAYSDRTAGEKGIIYQSCGFDYLGDSFGATYSYRHKDIPHEFTSQYLRRTSTFRSWCRANNIVTHPTWFKENGFKNLPEIPEEIKRIWLAWGKKIIEESEKIQLPQKLKYVLVLGKDKKEQKRLDSLKTYIALPYSKTTRPIQPIAYNPRKKHASGTGKTASRSNLPKIQFLIDNYGKLSRPELAKHLKETPRWVKRQLALLAKAGSITLKNPPPENAKSEADWTPELKRRAIELRRKHRRTLKEVSEHLQDEFSFEIHPKALFIWLNKFGCSYPSKEEWLEEFLTLETAHKLRAKDYTYKDIQAYIKESFDVHISTDLISQILRK